MVSFLPPRRRVDLDDHSVQTVSWLELYFDLVFVVSVIQAGNLLSDDVSLMGALRFGTVFTLLWWSWASTTMYFNSYVADDLIHRVLVLTQMFVIAHMAILVGQGFSEHSGWFIIAYATNRLLVAVLYARTLPQLSEQRQFAKTQITASIVSAACMICSVIAPPPYRYSIWALVMAAEIGSSFLPRFARFYDPDIDLEHLGERLALFTIIVLGESFIKTIGILTTGETGILQAEVFGAFGFVIGAAMWWTYFDDIASAKVRSGWLSHLIWAYVHLPMAMAITAFGVGTKKLAIQPPLEPMPANRLILITFSVSAFLFCVAVLDAVTQSEGKAFSTRARCIARLIASFAVALVGIVCRRFPAIVPATLMLLVGIPQILFELIQARHDRTSTKVSGIQV